MLGKPHLRKIVFKYPHGNYQQQEIDKLKERIRYLESVQDAVEHRAA
jgi:hypothetical protein